MALAPFFERVYGALGGHLAISRESLTKVLEEVTVGVRCGNVLEQNDVWTAEAITNLVARLYPRIAISGPKEHIDPLREIATRINPNIDIVDVAPNPTTICVGRVACEGALFPSASGWVARLDHRATRKSGATNPYAAGAASALACAEIFRRIFLKSTPEADFSVSLLKFDGKTGAGLQLRKTDIGEIVFVGAGAVGNAALWAMGRDKTLKGRIKVVDPETVELSNLQRYMLTAHSDVGMIKCDLAKRALASTNISIEGFQLALDKFADTLKSKKLTTVVVSIDNADGRRTSQALLPRLVINGWTGDHGLGASWHVFSRDAACLACLYHPHGQGVSATEQAAKALGLAPDRAALLWVTHQPMSEADLDTAAKTLGVDKAALSQWRGKSLGDFYTDVVCGAVPLDVTGVGRVETVPLAHQSALAGIFMAVELIKRTQPALGKISQVETLVSWDDIVRAPPALWVKPRPREPGCICGDEIYQSVYRKRWREKGPKRR